MIDPNPKRIHQARLGDTQAFGDLVTEYGPPLLRLIAGLAALGLEEREEVAQEAFVRAYERLDHFAPDSNFFAWVAGFARNIVCEHLARGKRRSELAQRLLDASLGQVRQADLERAQERVDLLRRCIDALPGKMRSIVEKFYREGLSLADLSRGLQIPVGTIKSVLHRSRTELRGCLERKS